MPGSHITTLLSFVASHLVLLTFAVFIVVGSWLFTDRGMQPDPEVRDQAPPPTNQASVQGGPPTDFRPDDDPKRPSPPSKAQPDPVGRTTQDAPVGERQPQLIGGTLPNYATGDGAFRPPVAGGAWSLTRPPDRASMVQTARRAFWNGDLEAAEAAYMDAIARYPDDPDLFGELGNLYVSIGRQQRALDAFYESALRLRAKGELEKLSEVIDLLEYHGYPDALQGDPRADR